MNVLNKVNDSNETEFPLLEYANCKYCQSRYLLDTYSEESSYFIHFITCKSESISRRNFKNNNLYSTRINEFQEYILYSQCDKDLILPKTEYYNSYSHCWLAFLWTLLSDLDIHKYYRFNI